VTTPNGRTWRLWQVETSFACNLACVMCPWRGLRTQSGGDGLMEEGVWAALRPHLPSVAEVDLSGGGEPLLHPHLAEWIAEAKLAGCRAGFLSNGSLLDEASAAGVIAAGVDWIGLSIESARAETFHRIRRGADFETFCRNVRRLTLRRADTVPHVLLNVVMMPSNIDELEDIVRLAASLQVDRVNFKQCDVIRSEAEREFGLFAPKVNRAIRRHQKAVAKARKLARKLGIETTAYGFVPDELPVCDQDPRSSVFVRCDGQVSPCINLALGGPSCFLGEDVVMPTVHYGRLPQEDLAALWETPSCRLYRARFEERVKAYERRLTWAQIGPSLDSLRETFAQARRAMPEAPPGCRTCHYLYDI